MKIEELPIWIQNSLPFWIDYVILLGVTFGMFAWIRIVIWLHQLEPLSLNKKRR